MQLKNKVALVTGASSGIGAAIATRFAEEGAKVVIGDLNEEAGQAIANDLPEAIFVKLDVSSAESFQAAVTHAVDTFGSLDILVNNAGIDIETESIADCDFDTWSKIISVNLEGAFHGMKFAVQQMKKQSGGAIVNIASVAALVGFPNRPAYSSSKGAVLQLTRATAIENAEHSIRVNAICPSGVQTPLTDRLLEKSPDPEATLKQIEGMTPLPGIVTPQAIAAASLFLASDEASFITGVTLPVDGGYTAR